MNQDEPQPFEKVLGDTSELRVLEKLLAMPSFEFSVSELAGITGLSRLSIYRVIDGLVSWRMVKSLDRGKRTRYRINEDSPLVQSLYDFNHALGLQVLGVDAALFESEGEEMVLRSNLRVEYAERLATIATPQSILVTAIKAPSQASRVAIA